VEAKVRTLRKPVEEVTKAAEQVGNMTNVDGAAKVQPVAVQTETWSGMLFTTTQGFLAGALVMLILLYFLLASGDLFLRKLVRILPTLEDKKVAVDIARQIEDQISTYLRSVTLINAGLAITVSIAMWVIGMPNPMLWGAMVGLFNFVPYVGPFTSLLILALVGVMTFDNLGWALLPPGIYFCIDAIESNFITPAFLGHRLSLNPVVVFIGVTFWAWLWGIGGALLAVPMLATFKIFCDQIEPLAALGEFLGP
jgi:predicted PurR-regulated permease PerM